MGEWTVRNRGNWRSPGRACARGWARPGAAAAVVTAAVVLSGCGGGGDEATKEPTARTTATAAAPSTTGAPTATDVGTPSAGTPSASTSATATGGGESTDSTQGATQGVEGIWLSMEDGVKVQLVLGKGKAGLTSAHLCGGGYTEHGGVDIVLTCMDGDKERTSGHGRLTADGKTLTVRWTGGPTDTFTRTGLPSS